MTKWRILIPKCLHCSLWKTELDVLIRSDCFLAPASARSSMSYSRCSSSSCCFSCCSWRGWFVKVQMYLLIICSEVNILLTNYIYLLSACFCASFDTKIFSIALLGHLPEAKNYPPSWNFWRVDTSICWLFVRRWIFC